MTDFTQLPRNIADCMKRAGAELSEDQKMLLAGYLAPVQQQIERLKNSLNKLMERGHDEECALLNYADDGCNCGYRDAVVAITEPPLLPSPHSDDVGVSKLANAMRDKLRLKREQGRGGWDNPEACTTQHLVDLLVGHLSKGDYVDIANFCMMLFNRGAGKEEIQQALRYLEAAAVEKAVEEVTKTARDNGFFTLDPDDFKNYIAELRK